LDKEKIKMGSIGCIGFIDKLLKKSYLDPLVPLGLCGTVSSLSVGIFAMFFRQRMLSLRMMKSRIIFQGLTVASVGLGHQKQESRGIYHRFKINSLDK
jgi:fluoride ion exporter CrcB/FEX